MKTEKQIKQEIINLKELLTLSHSWLDTIQIEDAIKNLTWVLGEKNATEK